MTAKPHSRSRPAAEPASWYDYPQYYDLVFRDETQSEADFFEAAFARYAQGDVRRVLEPGCGSGRLIIEMARRGYDVSGFDLNQPALKYLRRRLARRGLPAEVYVDDMARFSVARPFDAVFNTMNTFRHLLTEQAATGHLVSVADALRPGGLLVLGFHLLPLDVDEECTERWTARHAGTRVTATLRVLETRRRRRLEKLRISLRVRSRHRDLKLRDEFELRMYTARQFRNLLAKVPQFELLDVFDFWYDIDDPLPLDDEITDAVFVLRKT